MGYFVAYVEETVPVVTLRSVYESNGAQVDLSRTDFFI